MNTIDDRAIYKRAIDRINTNWQAFLDKRHARLAQQRRHDSTIEKVAENIVEDLLTIALDWEYSCINNQLKYADMVVSDRSFKYLVIETKALGSLQHNKHKLNEALDQAVRYATAQRVQTVAVSDGYLLYAADIRSGGLEGRVLVSLHSDQPDESLWWLSKHGITETAPFVDLEFNMPAATTQSHQEAHMPPDEVLRDSKLDRPAVCHAYVGDPTKPTSWKLPYLNEDGSPDTRRLGAAIQAVLGNHRGQRVDIPEEAVPATLRRLTDAAIAAGKMPFQCPRPAKAYVRLEHYLYQKGWLDEIKKL